MRADGTLGLAVRMATAAAVSSQMVCVHVRIPVLRRKLVHVSCEELVEVTQVSSLWLSERSMSQGSLRKGTSFMSVGAGPSAPF